MPSSASSLLRVELQATGENLNVWGEKQNDAVNLLEEAIAGVLTKSLTGNVTLSSTNFVSNEYRHATLVFTDGGLSANPTVTVPAVEKRYLVHNKGSTYSVIIAAGGTTCTILPGLIQEVYCDGTNCFASTLAVSAQASATAAAASATAAAASATSAAGSATAASGSATSAASSASSASSSASSATTTLAAVNAALTTANITIASQVEAVAGTDNAKLMTPLRVQQKAATTAQIWAGTTGYFVGAPEIYSAMAPVTLTDAATITPNFTSGRNFTVTLEGNRTLANPTNQVAGQSGVIRVVQDATGSRTLSYGSNWDFPGGAPVLTTTAGAVDLINYIVLTSGQVLAVLIRDFR